MPNSTLYERSLPHGPAVRIRRVSAPGTLPVTAVLEVDRRAGTPRASIGGHPPPLLTANAANETDVVEKLQHIAADDAEIARLLSQSGLR